MMNKQELELYLHIPFCARKCGYCDFLSFAADGGTQRRYVEQLIEEINVKSAAFRNRRVTTVFIGGGTPSILEGGLIARLLEMVKSQFELERDAEISMEANPGTLTKEKLSEYRRAGINRLSLGLQSTDDKELRLLGRIHTYEQFLESFRLARQAGFDNINVDLMSALPGQTERSWKQTLEKVIALRPEHISAYSLIVEEGTPFYDRYGGDGQSLLPDEDAERRMYHGTKERLLQAGYVRYEISNYARPGKSCRHNVGYWTGVEYLGLGLGASSFACGYRFENTREMEKYLAAAEEDMGSRDFYCFVEASTEQSRMEEFMFLGLRMMGGVSEQEFQVRFGQSMEAVYGTVLKKMETLGLMEQAQGRWRLTEAGVDVSNGVMAEFLL